LTAAQIERLKKDSREINHAITRLKKKGKDSRAHKLMLKKEFLEQSIQMTQ